VEVVLILLLPPLVSILVEVADLLEIVGGFEDLVVPVQLLGDLPVKSRGCLLHASRLLPEDELPCGAHHAAVDFVLLVVIGAGRLLPSRRHRVADEGEDVVIDIGEDVTVLRDELLLDPLEREVVVVQRPDPVPEERLDLLHARAGHPELGGLRSFA